MDKDHTIIAKHISDWQIIVQQVQRYSKISFVCIMCPQNFCFVECGFET